MESENDRPSKWITARDLARGAAALLDEVSTTGRTMKICRWGRPVAMLVPMPGTPVVDRVLGPQGDVVAEDDMTEESDEILAGLNEAERRVLPSFADGRWQAPRPELLEMNVPDYLVAVTRLEIKGLLEKSLSGYRITRRGQIALKGQPD